MVHSQPQRALLRLGVDNNVICDCRMCSVVREERGKCSEQEMCSLPAECVLYVVREDRSEGYAFRKHHWCMCSVECVL